MIVVFGSLGVDIITPVDRLPRPGENLVGRSYALRAGGKGANQAVAAARAGSTVLFFGRVGEDDFAHRITNALIEANIDITGVLTTQEEPTGCTSVSVDKNGETYSVSAACANLTSKAEQVPNNLLLPSTLLLLQTELTEEENWILLDRAKVNGCRVVVNASPPAFIPPTILRKIDILVTSEMEAAELDVMLGIMAESPEDFARAITFRTGGDCVVVLGPTEGALLASPGSVWRFEGFAVEVADMTGAMDSFCGTLAACLDEGLNIMDAVQRANISGAIASMGLGAQESLPSRKVIEEWVQHAPPAKRV
ncbi:MAG: PfkB family carbohydrate kinase [Alphaproteobacteria bacterium]